MFDNLPEFLQRRIIFLLQRGDIREAQRIYKLFVKRCSSVE